MPLLLVLAGVEARRRRGVRREVCRIIGVKPLERDGPGSEKRTAFFVLRGVLGAGRSGTASSSLTLPTLLRRGRRSAIGTSRSAIAPHQYITSSRTRMTVMGSGGHSKAQGVRGKTKITAIGKVARYTFNRQPTVSTALSSDVFAIQVHVEVGLQMHCLLISLLGLAAGRVGGPAPRSRHAVANRFANDRDL